MAIWPVCVEFMYDLLGFQMVSGCIASVGLLRLLVEGTKWLVHPLSAMPSLEGGPLTVKLLANFNLTSIKGFPCHHLLG